MIRRIIYLFLFVCIFNLHSLSQNKTLVIYVDAIANPNAFLLKNKIFDAIQESDSKLILFISNGAKPITCNNIFDAQKAIDQIDKLNAKELNVTFDLDTLNKIFSEDSILFGLNQNTNTEDIAFFFFFDAERCRKFHQDRRIAEALLLSNRLINKNGLKRNCKATLYIHRMENVDLQYFSKIKDDGIFKIEVY